MHHDAYEWWFLAFTGFAALGTVGALLWAFCLYLKERNRQLAAEKVEREASERAEADLVAAWIEVDPALSPGNRKTTVRNGGTLPVFNVRLLAASSSNEVSLRPFGLVAPGSRSGPLEFADVIIDGTAIPQAFLFEDSANRKWFRDWHGALHRCPEEGSQEWNALMYTNATPPWMPLPQ